MSLPGYSEYRDCGVAWLGDVPAQWVITPIKYLGNLKGGAGFPHSDQGLRDEEIPFHKVNALAQAGFDGVLLRGENSISLDTAERLGAFVFPAGSLVFAKVGAALLMGRIRKISEPACIDNNMMGFVIDETNHDVEFIRYALSLVQFDLIANPGTVPSLNESQIGNYWLSIPNKEEQKVIANFLNQETAKIDGLIAEQEKLIALLAEKRQATISHAVTKGLNPDVPMKDSGVAWLGEVPEHWSIKPLRYCIDFQEGPGIMAADFEESGIPLLRVSGVQNRWASLDGCNYLNAERVANKWHHFRLEEGDLLISASASMGTVCEIGPDTAGSIPYTGLIRLRGKTDEMIKPFVRSLVVSAEFMVQIDLLKAGATIQHFGPTHLSQMIIARPPIDEQEYISAFIEHESARLDELTAEATRGITLLKERRSALISAAVTGKIDVRQLAVAEAA